MLTTSANGARLAYVVVDLHQSVGTVKRPVTTWTKKDGLKTKMVEEPAGYLVYFPAVMSFDVKIKRPFVSTVWTDATDHQPPRAE